MNNNVFYAAVRGPTNTKWNVWLDAAETPDRQRAVMGYGAQTQVHSTASYKQAMAAMRSLSHQLVDCSPNCSSNCSGRSGPTAVDTEPHPLQQEKIKDDILSLLVKNEIKSVLTNNYPWTDFFPPDVAVHDNIESALSSELMFLVVFDVNDWSLPESWEVLKNWINASIEPNIVVLIENHYDGKAASTHEMPTLIQKWVADLELTKYEGVDYTTRLYSLCN